MIYLICFAMPNNTYYSAFCNICCRQSTFRLYDSQLTRKVPAIMSLKEVVKLGEYEEQRRDGQKIKFTVQTVPRDMEEETVEFMTNHFLPREPMCAGRIYGDPISTKTLQGLWRQAIQGGTCLMALKIDDDERAVLIGANMTPISEKKKSSGQKFEGENFNDVLEALIDIALKGDIFENYGVDRYMTGYGLTVDPAYSGFNVGLRLLECRRPLCALLGVEATGTVFTAAASQHLAAKVGFETLYECEHATYTVNGRQPFLNVPGTFKMMGLKF